MDIKEYIKDIVREIISEDELEEMSTSGDAGAYSTPYAFRGNKKGENAATKAAISQGFKKASTSLPKNSKVVDYKQLFEDEYEMNQDPKTKEFTKRVKLSDKDKETVKKIQALMAKQKSLKEDIQNNFEVKVGDTLENIRTGVLTKIKSIKGNNITGVIIDLGDGSSPGIKMGDVNKTSKLLINKTYKLISSIGESLENIVKEELLNEVTYHKFKNEVKFRTKNEQLHKAIREVKRKLSEIDRIVEYTSRMKQELSEGEEGIKYWRVTEKYVGQIAETINQLSNKIKNLQQ
jgi:hypothetical protein